MALLVDDGMEPGDIADALHVPPSVVDSRLVSLGSPTSARRAVDRVWDATLAAGQAAGEAARRGTAALRRDGLLPDLLLVTAVAVVLMAPIADNLLEGRTVMAQNDNVWVIEQGAKFDLWPFSPPTPHFLFPLLIRLLVAGAVPAGPAALVVLIGVRAAAAAAIYLVMRDAFDDGGPRLRRGSAVVATISLIVMESPRVLLQGVDIRGRDGFVPLQTLYNASGMTVVPVAVVAVALVSSFVRRATTDDLTTGRSVVTTLSLLLAGIAKPSFSAVFLPVLPFWVWWTGRHAPVPLPRLLRSAALWLIGPLAALTAWQLWWIAQPERTFAHGGASTIVWSPFTLARAWGADHPAMWLALVVPLAGLLVGGRRWAARPKVVLLGAATTLGLLEFLLLTESGVRSTDGSLGWGAQIAIVLLCVESVRVLGEAWEHPALARPRRRLRLAVGCATVAVCVAAGAVVVVRDGTRNTPCIAGEVGRDGVGRGAGDRASDCL